MHCMWDSTSSRPTRCHKLGCSSPLVWVFWFMNENGKNSLGYKLWLGVRTSCLYVCFKNFQYLKNPDIGYVESVRIKLMCLSEEKPKSIIRWWFMKGKAGCWQTDSYQLTLASPTKLACQQGLAQLPVQFKDMSIGSLHSHRKTVGIVLNMQPWTQKISNAISHSPVQNKSTTERTGGYFKISLAF